MPKYGRGLNREIVAAVNAGELREPLTVRSVHTLAASRGWRISDAVMNVTLANAASETHSPTPKKYFESLGNGRYRVRAEYRGRNWS